MATIRDVAREAGVGVGTVSRVLSGHPRVARETRARVEAAIARLHFRPSRAAQSLSRGRTHTIEVISPPISRYFYADVVGGIEDVLRAAGYALVIRTVERAADRERAFADLVARFQADGAIILSLRVAADDVQRLRAAGSAAVLIDSEQPGLFSVAVDHEAGAAAAVRHLIALGHERIALVDRADDPLSPQTPSHRHRGYQLALAEAGLPLRPEYERIAEWSPAGGMQGVDALLALPEPPTALFAGSDMLAIGALEGARQRGLRVPGDLGVVGYNDIDVAEYLGLTTVQVPMREMGRRGAEGLLALLAGAVPPPVRLPTQLIVRRSCGPPGRVE